MKVSIIATGGTIGSFQSSSGIKTSASGRQKGLIEDILGRHPDFLNKIKPTIKSPIVLMSENIIPDDWAIIANSIKKEIDEGAKAIIVTHGTDTMIYTICAMSIMLSNIPIPIIFTGALYPQDHLKSDAEKNVWASLRFVLKCKYAGPYLVFADPLKNYCYAYWGPRVTMLNQHLCWFSTIDNTKVAKISDIDITQYDIPRYIKKRVEAPTALDTRISDRVSLVKVYPGFKPNLLYKVADAGSDIIILDLYHSGTACVRSSSNERYSFIPVLRKLRERQIMVFGTTSPYYRSNEAYKSTNILVQHGLKTIGLMTPEMAYVKAVCLLGRNLSRSQILKEMRSNYAGEIVEEEGVNGQFAE